MIIKLLKFNLGSYVSKAENHCMCFCTVSMILEEVPRTVAALHIAILVDVSSRTRRRRIVSAARYCYSIIRGPPPLFFFSSPSPLCTESAASGFPCVLKLALASSGSQTTLEIRFYVRFREFNIVVSRAKMMPFVIKYWNCFLPMRQEIEWDLHRLYGRRVIFWSLGNRITNSDGLSFSFL